MMMTEFTPEDRLGLNDLVCQNCNARNDPSRKSCRKCGSKEFRERNPIDKYE